MPRCHRIGAWVIAGGLTLGFSMAASAADPPTFGLEGGINFNSTSLSGSDAAGLETTSKTGGTIGGFVGIPISPMFSIQPEVIYTTKSVKVSGTGSMSGYTANIQADFVEIPVLAKINLTKMKSLSYYVVAGPGFAFTTTAKLTDQNFGGQTFPDEDLKAEDSFHSSDFTLIVGFGLDKGPLGVEVRYDAGLLNMNKATATDTNIKFRVFSILGRWSFKK